MLRLGEQEHNEISQGIFAIEVLMIRFVVESIYEIFFIVMKYQNQDLFILKWYA